MLVSLAEASEHLRRDGSDDDMDVKVKIKAASKAILNYLKKTSPYTPELDSNGDPALDSAGKIIYEETSDGEKIVLPEVKEAVLYLLGIFYRDRDGQDMTNWEQGYLPFPVIALLNPLRNPAMA
jgi:hypothetical protein